MPVTPTYDRTTIALHWTTAGLVAVLWVLAQVIDFFPPGMPRVAARSTHVLLGVVLIFVLVARILWRRYGGIVLPPAEAGWKGTAGKAMHHLLYLVIVLLLVGGVMNAWVRGDDFYGIFRIPSFAPGNRTLRSLIGGLHELAANAILILAGLHAAMALAHHFILKDGVLRRMWPSI